MPEMREDECDWSGKVMDEREKMLFDFINDKYGNAEYADGFIYFTDEDTGIGYKVAVYTTN